MKMSGGFAPPQPCTIEVPTEQAPIVAVAATVRATVSEAVAPAATLTVESVAVIPHDDGIEVVDATVTAAPPGLVSSTTIESLDPSATFPVHEYMDPESAQAEPSRLTESIRARGSVTCKVVETVASEEAA